MTAKTYHLEMGGKKISLEFNKFAKQTNASVMVTCGATQVLVCVTAADSQKEGQDFLPLTVDYIEKFYSAGKIPGGYLKRESKPSDREVLTARTVDRPLRPCFPEGYYRDTFVTIFVMSYDQQNHPAPLATLGASAALMVSNIPFEGPVASLRIGMDSDRKLVIDPPEDSPLVSLLDLSLAAKKDAILMVEAGAAFLTEEEMLEAIQTAHKTMQPAFDLQVQIQKEIGLPKVACEAPERKYLAPLTAEYKTAILEAFGIKDKQKRNQLLKTIKDQAKEKHLAADCSPNEAVCFRDCFETLTSNLMREMVLKTKVRIDGRKLDEIRPIHCEVGTLIRPHGSALFTRGETQALGVVTLGAGDDAQRLDSINFLDKRKNFLLHYNFPPLCVGEARPMRPPGRREVGHGSLAEKALVPVLPTAEEFGYTIRLVSEVLESNGSSSMATVCAGTMAMYHAGVPLKEPIAGIAMGLVLESENEYAVLSDILGDEDFLGDMDFKVCGNAAGITALQMDIKISGINQEVLKKALSQAKAGRLHILEKMNATISKAGELSSFAPRIFEIRVKPDKIKDLIGPGGKVIKKIIADTGVKLDVNDDGRVQIVAQDIESAKKAEAMVLSIATDPEIGAIYHGVIKKVVDFGCFVEIKPNVEGLCHISQLDNRRVTDIFSEFSEGQEIDVKVIDVDGTGRIKLSRKDALESK